MVKYHRIQVFVERDGAGLVYVKNERMQARHLSVIDTEFFGSLTARLVPPAIGEQHTANIKKQEFYRRITHGLYFIFLIFDSLQQFFERFIEFINTLIF